MRTIVTDADGDMDEHENAVASIHQDGTLFVLVEFPDHREVKSSYTPDTWRTVTVTKET